MCTSENLFFLLNYSKGDYRSNHEMISLYLYSLSTYQMAAPLKERNFLLWKKGRSFEKGPSSIK